MKRDINPILPTEQVVALSPFHTLTSVTVHINPDECHNMGIDKFMLAKSQLDTIASAAGIQITESHQVESSEADIISWQVTAHIDRPDGLRISRPGTYSLDLRYRERNGTDGAIMNQLLAQRRERMAKIKAGEIKPMKGEPSATASDEEWEQYNRSRALAELLMIERHKIARAETGAALRAIRGLLGIKPTYSRAELSRPFVVYRASFDVARAISAGGQIADMARRALGMSLAKQLGLSQDTIDHLVSLPEPTQQSSVDLESFVVEMLAAGFQSREQLFARLKEVFGADPAQLDSLHLAITKEMVNLRKIASKSMTPAELQAFSEHLVERARLAYYERTSVIDLIDSEWYNKLELDHGANI